MTPAKACTVCGETLPLTDYSPNRHHSDGRQSACKMCVADRIHWARAAGTYNDEPPSPDPNEPGGRRSMCKTCVAVTTPQAAAAPRPGTTRQRNRGMRVHTITEAPCGLCAWRGRGIMGWTVRVNKHNLRLTNGFGLVLPWWCQECGHPFGVPRITLTLEPEDAARVTAAWARKWGT